MGRMEADEFGELDRSQISDVGLPMREFKQHPESNTALGGWGGGESKDPKFRELRLLIETFT